MTITSYIKENTENFPKILEKWNMMELILEKTSRNKKNPFSARGALAEKG